MSLSGGAGSCAALTVTVCGLFQFEVENRSVPGDTVRSASLPARIAGATVTVPVGLVSSTTV